MDLTTWLAGIVLVVSTGAVYAARRGWIYSGFRKPESRGSGAFGELMDAFHPSHSFVAEELNRDHPSFEDSELVPFRYDVPR